MIHVQIVPQKVNKTFHFYICIQFKFYNQLINMKCFGFIPVYMSSIIIAIFNIVFGFSDLIYMIHAYSKLDNWTTLESVFILLSVSYNVLQICLIYGLIRKKPKIILIWILLEAIMLVVSLQSNLFICQQGRRKVRNCAPNI